MSNPSNLADAQAREQALDPQDSFIVQAPAGSGKTGLLSQRFLCLLSLVEHPEEVVAITFTRKAAAEMKHRILEALQAAHAQPPPDPENPFAYRTWQLSQAALQRDNVQKWHILANPGRLRILTIDAFCANLTRQLPLLSGLGGRFSVTEDNWEQYQLAARAALEEGQKQGKWSPAIAALLDHLDNYFSSAETLLANMLSRRDQWLRHVGITHPDSRQLLEYVLQQVIIEGLTDVAQQLSEAEKEEIWSLAGFAGDNLRQTAPSSPLTNCYAEQPFPAIEIENQNAWLAIADLLLTSTGTWRKRLDKRSGFPPASQGKSKEDKQRFKEMKARITALLQSFSDRTALLSSIQQLRNLPPAHYTDEQWHILEALLKLLPMAVAQLKIQFQELGKVDFSEIAMRAETALGEPEEPTDLALKLDYQIRHLLVDEFQDTSHGQFRLLERLTAGWDGMDGRSLFLVGDPMQSIYRFREAEVGLFLQARQQGIGMIQLTPLTLSVNFRSQATMVNWINQAFVTILPDEEDITAGAVSFNPSHPFQPAIKSPAVTIHPFQQDDRQSEAQEVVALASAAMAQKNPGKIAILVRSRPHLEAILPALDQAGLRYQGIDIESLAKSMAIQDLLSLTRALTAPADNIAWLALLRAPWCGLSLTDLHTIVHISGTKSATMWEKINHESLLPQLSHDGQHHLQRIQTVLMEALTQYRRVNTFPGSTTLRFWVEHTWQSLGGPATLQRPEDLLNVQSYFALLAKTEQGGTIPDYPSFAEKVSKLYAGLDEEATENLLIMTIHKAKGLEFDTVILPGLGRTTRPEEKTLLAWMEHPKGLLLAPIKRTDQEQDDPIHAYIRHLESRKSTFEAGRLLYVAATRARTQLHLLGHVTVNTEERIKPASGSFLHLLWDEHRADGVASHFLPAEAISVPGTESTLAIESTLATESTPGTKTGQPILEEPPPKIAFLRRLSNQWSQPPPPPAFVESLQDDLINEEVVPFEWAGETVRLVGIVVHRFLYIMAKEGLSRWTESHIVTRTPAYAAHLDRLGVPEEQMDGAIKMVQNSLLQTITDERGQWILDNNRHKQAVSELAITGLLDNRLQRLVLDRTFIDQQGRRWIIDFKTSFHQGGDLEGFLDNEISRYQEQMERYAALVKKMDQEHGHPPIHLGLYFPMHVGWRSWQAKDKIIPGTQCSKEP